MPAFEAMEEGLSGHETDAHFESGADGAFSHAVVPCNAGFDKLRFLDVRYESVGFGTEIDLRGRAVPAFGGRSGRNGLRFVHDCTWIRR